MLISTFRVDQGCGLGYCTHLFWQGKNTACMASAQKMQLLSLSQGAQIASPTSNASPYALAKGGRSSLASTQFQQLQKASFEVYQRPLKSWRCEREWRCCLQAAPWQIRHSVHGADAGGSQTRHTDGNDLHSWNRLHLQQSPNQHTLNPHLPNLHHVHQWRWKPR